jgi:hypothetical protein
LLMLRGSPLRSPDLLVVQQGSFSNFSRSFVMSTSTIVPAG